MNTFVITGARIVTPNKIIDNGFLFVKKGIIEAIDVVSCQRLHRSLERIDGRDMWLLPGIVNICDRSLEKELTESNTSLDMSFITTENNIAGCGITTVNHILSQCSDQVTGCMTEIKRLRKYSAIRHLYYALPVSGTAEVLYADLCPLSILYSIFSLTGSSRCSMPESVNLATLNPARLLGIDKKLGSLEAGKIADMILVREINGIILVEKVFVDGYKIIEKRYL